MLDRLFNVLGWSSGADDYAIGEFLAGASVPQTAAQLGYAGADMIAGQRGIEAQLRAYIGELEAEIAALQAQVAACCGE